MTDQLVGAAPAAPPADPDDREAGARRTAKMRRWRRTGLVLLGWVAMFALWEFGSWWFGSRLLPRPYEVFQSAVEIVESGNFLTDFTASVLKTFAGFAVAAAVGAPVGYLMGRYNYWRAFFHDGVTIAGTIPAIVYAVMSLIVFGLSNLGPILAVALVSAPYIALNVAEGIRGVDKQLITMSEAFGRSPQQIRREVLMPTIVPYVFAAIRMCFAVAWKVEALTEVFGGRNGVGFQIRTEYQLYDIAAVLAWMFLFIVFMLVIERLVLAKSEARLLAWRPQERSSAL
ncbi:ABC transporter permease [Paractinoplanes rishiriensis]|uniref:Nitrate ABC transporter permease n=1 Tax=Paractinoplanes rishiriensis TaxID=1050105 RepID=A0A919MRR0_9ACTN|nr:ABC transporter permease subunit [Actinoplanes rishiriensis]GIE97476.1 nitrate ABC transporter permease [Actinoplanes rishiriensis]